MEELSMLNDKHGRIVVGLIVLVLVAAVAFLIGNMRPAVAQMYGAEEAVEGTMPPMGGSEAPSGQMPGGYRMMPPPMMGGGGSGGVAITAAEGYVYVVKGNTLYQFSSRTLKMEKSAEIGSSQTPTQNRYYPQGGGQ